MKEKNFRPDWPEIDWRIHPPEVQEKNNALMVYLEGEWMEKNYEFITKKVV